MQLGAMRHRPESEDCFVLDRDHLRVRFHTAKNDVDKVIVYYGDTYFSLNTYDKAELSKIGVGEVDDHWGITLRVPYHRVQYVFEVIGKDGKRVLVGDRGFRSVSQDNFEDFGNYFKMPYFHEIDMIKTPEWVHDTVWYQIFPERFANGDKNNDPKNVKPWDPKAHPSRTDFYGGDLQGVLDHLDYLQDLGITGLYFCPIFKAESNHKYDTIDYFSIDPEFGDKALFERLVNEAHKRGMKVMLDAVFNHMGYKSMQWQDVLRNGRESRFADWFHISNDPRRPFVDPSKNNAIIKLPYETFAFEPKMPKLKTSNPEVFDYLLSIAKYWVKEFDIDAWRLDVANEVNHHFWHMFRHTVKQIKPDFYIVGEVWHSAQPWLNGYEFSGVMNYPFTQQIEDHFLNKKRSAKELIELLTDQLMLYRSQTNQAMLNMLDSHDTPRLLTMAHDDKDLALQTLFFMFMQTGSPCIYYGTEMGMDGEQDPDNRKPMDWDKKDSEIWQLVKDIIHFRRNHSDTLSQGKTDFEITKSGLIKVKRTRKETLIAYFNTTDKPVKLNANPIFGYRYCDEELLPKGYVVTI